MPGRIGHASFVPSFALQEACHLHVGAGVHLPVGGERCLHVCGVRDLHRIFLTYIVVSCVFLCVSSYHGRICMRKSYVSASVSDVGFSERRSAERSRREMVRYCRICEAWGYFACALCVLVAYLSGAIC